MKNTYTLVARSCEFPSISVEITANFHQMSAYYKVLIKAFREVEAFSDDTGEVIVRFYASDEFFHRSLSHAEAIEQVQALYKAFQER